MEIKVETEFRLLDHRGDEVFGLFDSGSDSLCGNPLFHGAVFQVISDTIEGRMRKLIDAQFGAVKASPKIRVDDNSYDIPIEKNNSYIFKLHRNFNGRHL